MEQDEIEFYHQQKPDAFGFKNQKDKTSDKVDKLTITNLGVFMDVLNKCNP